jgi:uncharacterized membrane protein
MSIYPIALFLHVSGAIGYFVGMGIWLFGLSAMRRAQHVEQVRTLAHLVGLTGPLFGISVLVLLAAGVYMALTAGSLLTGWIMVGLVSLVLLAPLGTALLEPRRLTIDRQAREAADGSLPEALERSVHDPVLLTAVQTLTILLLGVVFLMTTKPDLVGSLIVMGVALLLGLASSVLVSQMRRTPRQGMVAKPERSREPVG